MLNLNGISIKYFNEELNPESYKKIVSVFYDLDGLLRGDTETKEIINLLEKYNEFKINIKNEDKRLSLDEILIKNFKSGFEKPTDDYCPSYGTLIDMLYDVGNIINYNMNGLVDTLDEITYEC